MNTEIEKLRQSLIQVSARLPSLSPFLPEPDRKQCEAVVSMLDRSIIPQLAADCPLLVAVTGGGSSGKSTVFNLLAGKTVSAAGPKAGFTRRMVAAIHPNVAADKRKMELLFERFRSNARPRKLENPDEALDPGDPIYVECPDIPEHLVLIDTPDFDTGTRESFTNRDAAKEVLDVADVILYVTTNTLYNNKSSADFVRSVLSEVGIRKVALLYRIYSFHPDEMVRDHMGVALANLYPDASTAKDACLGIWRIDESNEVAAGKQAPEIRPLAGGIPLVGALTSLDPTKTRARVMGSGIKDALRLAGTWVGSYELTAREFEAYRDSLRFLTSDACKQCMAVAPQRDILRLFAEEWKLAQPWFVRNGRWLSETLRRTAGRVFKGKSRTDDGPAFEESFRKAFLAKARELQRIAKLPTVRFDFPKSDRDLRRLEDLLRDLSEQLPEGYAIRDMEPKKKDGLYAAMVARPELPSADGPDKASAGESLSAMVDRAVDTMGDTEKIRPEVQKLVKEFRARMTAWQTAKEYFSASLDSLAVAGTVGYVVLTGDVLTGGTALSMFGWNDLVAVPALSAYLATKLGIDRKTTEGQMSKLFTAWAKEKAPVIRRILEDGITKRDIDACDESFQRISSALGNLRTALEAARKHAAAVFPA